MKRIIPVLLLMLIYVCSFSQIKREPLTTDDLNNQVKSLLENPKIFKKIIQQNESGDLNVYIDCGRFKDLSKEEPIKNNGYNAYYWDKEGLFFKVVDSKPHLELISIISGPKNIDVELITRSNGSKEYFILLKLVDFDNEKKERTSPKIDKIKISTIKM